MRIGWCRTPRGAEGAARLLSRTAASILLILAGCTPDESEPAEPGPVARSFLAAWSSQDEDGMTELLDELGAAVWDDYPLEGWFEATLVSGEVDSFSVAPAGPVDASPRGAVDAGEGQADALAPYAVTYVSRAAARPVRIEGELPLSYRAASDSWVVAWRKEHMWPGIPEARGFVVTRSWPRRGPIVDRAGRHLARGSGNRRSYPAGSTGGSTVGHLGVLTRRGLADAPAGRARGDLIGASGLEKAFEDRLAGIPQATLHAADVRREPIEVLGRTRSRPGRRTRATLDLRVQRAAERAFGATVGGAVVIDPATGDLLAIVSSAPFNPNNYVGSRDIRPFNRALSGLYPPGSSLKVMTAAGAIDARVVTRDTRLTGPPVYRGVRNFESGRYDSLDLATAVKFSVNTAFAQVALKLGGRRLTRYAEAFGFNRPHDMPLDAATSSFPPPEDEGDLMWGAIGQAQVVATPLQMATIAATVANDGVRMDPRIAMHEAPEGVRVVSARTASVMTALMEDVVVGGTGQAARLSGVRVAGKTGTAEVDAAGRLNHAWFICFAPAGDPKVAVAVVAELGGVGGRVAAPVAGRILANVLPLVR